MKLDVVGMLYRGYFYYAYLVGPYAPPLYGVSTTSSIIPHHVVTGIGVTITVCCFTCEDTEPETRRCFVTNAMILTD